MKRLLCYLASAALLCGFGIPASAEVDQRIPIADRAGLEAIADKPGLSYVLTDNIDLSGALWQPIPFSGTLDGGGYTIYNLTIREPDATVGTSMDGNDKTYDTYFAGLFSYTDHASISNLHLLGVDVFIDSPHNCFAGALIGCAVDTAVTDCSITGRASMNMYGQIGGVGGVIGFGYGPVKRVTADVELVLTDKNTTYEGETFLGGIEACGYSDFSKCDVTLRGYASIHGYVHNGGIIGMMHVHTSDVNRRAYIKYCTVRATIDFFEHCSSRRAYCRALVGENLNKKLKKENNYTPGFERNEHTDYGVELLPETCISPVYQEDVTAPGAAAFGYTTHTCTGCGYHYRDQYTPPLAQ